MFSAGLRVINYQKVNTMSLDVYLYSKTPVKKSGTGVFIRENGAKRELTLEEVVEKFPCAEVKETEYETDCVFDANITHNLGEMADKAGIYYALWRPEEIGKGKASEIIELLEEGLNKLKASPDYFKQFNSPNGWGMYEHFVPFVEEYLEACRKYPDATIEVSR